VDHADTVESPCDAANERSRRRHSLQQITMVPVDRDKLQHLFSEMRRGKKAAINDRSIANGLSVAPYQSVKPAFHRSGFRIQISNIGEILSSPK
jgi:hypothetical protein